jgi:hypothetical protein
MWRWEAFSLLIFRDLVKQGKDEKSVQSAVMGPDFALPARSSFTLLAVQRLSALPRQRVFGSADHSAADRTLDRAEAAQV